jgi:hypothetical protein
VLLSKFAEVCSTRLGSLHSQAAHAAFRHRSLMLCRVLALESNQLEGTIPFSIGSLASLSSLTVDHNRITDIPSSLSSVTALRYDEQLPCRAA